MMMSTMSKMKRKIDPGELWPGADRTRREDVWRRWRKDRLAVGQRRGFAGRNHSMFEVWLVD